ncbi:hypothetical protein ACOMHN_033481 [Nucella lapillus]
MLLVYKPGWCLLFLAAVGLGCVSASEDMYYDLDYADGEDSGNETVSCRISEVRCEDDLECIPGTSICDGQPDCSDWSDEKHYIDECEPVVNVHKREPACSQICINTRGSYHCDCSHPYSMEPDRRSCRMRRLLYILDSYQGVVVACTMEGMACAIIVEGLDDRHPGDLLVDPISRTIFWVENQSPSAIMRCDLDGRHREVFFNAHVLHMDHLQIDYPAGLMYWVDTAQGSIQRLALDTPAGNGIKFVRAFTPYGMKNPTAVAVVEEWVIWAERSSGVVMKANKWTGGDRQRLIKHHRFVTGAVVLHPAMQPEGVKTTPFLLVGSSDHITQIPTTNIGHLNMRQLSTPRLQGLRVMGVNPVTQEVIVGAQTLRGRPVLMKTSSIWRSTFTKKSLQNFAVYNNLYFHDNTTESIHLYNMEEKTAVTDYDLPDMDIQDLVLLVPREKEPSKEEEEECPEVNVCDQFCFLTSRGPVCSCDIGYKLASDGRACTGESSGGIVFSVLSMVAQMVGWGDGWGDGWGGVMGDGWGDGWGGVRGDGWGGVMGGGGDGWGGVMGGVG